MSVVSNVNFKLISNSSCKYPFNVKLILENNSPTNYYVPSDALMLNGVNHKAFSATGPSKIDCSAC